MTKEIILNKEVKNTTPYIERIKEELKGLRMWDYLSYDKEGNLHINGLKIVDIAQATGTPLEIVDTRIAESRAKEWINLSEKVAKKVGYKGGIDYLYASKADPAAEITSAAIRAGWGIETSSALDLVNVEWLLDNGIAPKDLKIVCNGLKLHPVIYNKPYVQAELPKDIKVNGMPARKAARHYGVSYAEMITKLASSKANIVPVIDSIDELNYFGQPDEIPAMDVGVRLKVYGTAFDNDALSKLVARHGMDWETTKEAAERIKKIPHLTLTMFHAMMGAAETIPVDDIVGTILGYNHEEFLTKLFTGLKERAEKHDCEEPIMIFEFGSYIAAEAGHHVMQILSEKINSVDENGETTSWAIVDTPFMRAIPDMLVIGRDDFIVLAANNANSSAKYMRLGDLTCDSDGRWPTKDMEKKGKKGVLVPVSEKKQLMVIVATKAYGEQLSGVGGVGHCGLMEPVELIIEEIDGKPNGRLVPRQNYKQARELLGYNQKSIKSLKAATRGKK
jgi:arginine decarboxylase